MKEIICKCGHPKSIHARWGSRTHDIANDVCECLDYECDCQKFRKAK